MFWRKGWRSENDDSSQAIIATWKQFPKCTSSENIHSRSPCVRSAGKPPQDKTRIASLWEAGEGVPQSSRCGKEEAQWGRGRNQAAVSCLRDPSQSQGALRWVRVWWRVSEWAWTEASSSLSPLLPVFLCTKSLNAAGPRQRHNLSLGSSLTLQAVARRKHLCPEKTLMASLTPLQLFLNVKVYFG